jgi:hypothetical protein
VVDDILAACHCTMSESGQGSETVDRHGSDESVINKILGPTEISAHTSIRIEEFKKSQKFTKLSVDEVDWHSFGVLKANTDRLCGLVVRVSGYRSKGPGFDSRFSEKQRVWNGVRSAS